MGRLFCPLKLDTGFPKMFQDVKSEAPAHNPFSMPHMGLDSFDLAPLEIYAYQYDLVCNGVEIASGAMRNYLPEIMYRAFAVTGYSRIDVENKFGGLLSAFRYGTPPHAGCAVGIDRLIMLLTGAENIRESIAFPLNQNAEDLLLGAPST